MTTEIPTKKTGRHLTFPLWAVIGAGVLILLLFIAVGAAGSTADADTAEPAASVQLANTGDTDAELAEVKADLAAAEATISDCQATVAVMSESGLTVMTGFQDQMGIALDIATYGITDEIVDRQGKITATITEANDILDTAPGCK